MGQREYAEAWKQWLRANLHRLLLFARQQTQTEADAQDVLQDAVIRVWNVQRAKPTAEEPSPAEVFTAIRRCAIDLARKENRRLQREKLFVESEPEPVVWFENRLESKEQDNQIEEALRMVPARFREIIILKIWGELTFIEISKTLDIPVNTAASRYRYGLESMKKQLNLPVA